MQAIPNDTVNDQMRAMAPKTHTKHAAMKPSIGAPCRDHIPNAGNFDCRARHDFPR